MASLHSGDLPFSTFSYLTDSDTVNKIDAEIVRLQDRILFLRSMRNSLAPVSRLPTEITSKIFLICQAIRSPLLNDSRLYISWVSRHWRNVALEYLALWSEITINHPDRLHSHPGMLEYIAECFIRSKQMPLTMSYCGPRAQVFPLCASQLHRTRELSIYHQSREGEFIASLPKYWKGSAPLLVDLYLDRIRLEEDMFGDTDPPLRCISLSSCDLSKISRIPGLSTLTTLTMSHTVEHIAPEVMVSMLQAMPLLRTCTLEACFSYLDPAAIVTGYQACVPSLKHLLVTDFGLDHVGEFLERLEMPNASSEVIIHWDRVTKREFRQQFQWFAGYQARVWKNPRRLDVVHGRRHGRDAQDALTATVYGPRNKQFIFSVEQTDDPFKFDPVVSASSYLPLDSVPILYIDTDNLSIDKLNSLGSLPLVKTLQLEYVTPDFLGWAISSSREVFPSVKKLTVSNVSYRGFKGFIKEKLKESDDGL